MQSSFAQTPAEVLSFLKTSQQRGLSELQATERLVVHGRNELPSEPQTPLWKLVLEQFQDKLVLILLFAAFISFVLALLEDSQASITTFVEPIVILLILIANALVGVVQETNAEKALEALKEYSPDECKVIRDAQTRIVDARSIVPGDIVVLSVGDKVPADLRLLEITSSSFKIDQSILTGEPFGISKDADVVIADLGAVKQDQVNICFSGTSVTVGKALGVVVQTGCKTAIGEIHSSILEVVEEKSPLKQALDDFGDQLAQIITVICVLVWLINIRHFQDEAFGGNWIKGSVYYFKIAVALAVAAIPEGLAVIITTCLALGTQKMAAQGAIVRKLRSVETLGCTSVICSDKTGTLTTNQMSIRKIITFEKASTPTEYNVEGTTYSPAGRIMHPNGTPIDRNVLVKNSCMNELCHIAALCNDSELRFDELTNSFTKIGEPTEAAIKCVVEKLGTDSPEFNIQIPFIDEQTLKTMSSTQKRERVTLVNEYTNSLYKKHSTFEFARDRKSMSVLVERLSGGQSNSGYFTRKSAIATNDGKKLLFVKGAPEQILERCQYLRISSMYDKPVKMTPMIRESILSKIEEWGQDALRVLAFATVDSPIIPAKPDQTNFAQIESNMCFVGLMGMLDPPRPEVLQAVAECRKAGIRVIVITGDNKKTAESICRNIGVFTPTESLISKSYTGREFDAMSDVQKQEAVMKASLFSRTEPTHKFMLVELLQKNGLIVAMTGDGVNDAPALKKADIGVSMGSGTDVAKLASDIILSDDNFSTIISAVREGRSIYSNTQQFIRYLISSNIGEVISIFLTVLLGMPEALIPVQLLWVNLVTDGLPATALGFNPTDDNVMRNPPRNPREPLVTGWLFFRYLVIGIYVGCATVFGYIWFFCINSSGPLISFTQLTSFHNCSASSWIASTGKTCAVFSSSNSRKGTTMSLSILVVVEMLNAINSLSENESLLVFPVWRNPLLLLSIVISMLLHLMILYIPFFTELFAITSLDSREWLVVLCISAPVILVDEVLKLVSRNFVGKRGVFVEKIKSE